MPEMSALESKSYFNLSKMANQKTDRLPKLDQTFHIVPQNADLAPVSRDYSENNEESAPMAAVVMAGRYTSLSHSTQNKTAGVTLKKQLKIGAKNFMTARQGGFNNRKEEGQHAFKQA